jgi:hypothetical protein
VRPRNSTAPRTSGTVVDLVVRDLRQGASSTSTIRPMAASPRSKMFTTQPMAIIGQCSMAR